MKTRFTNLRKQTLPVLVIIICLSFVIKTPAQICSNPNSVIYGLSINGFIYPITVESGAASAAINPAYSGNTPDEANGLGYNSQNGKFYYFKRNAHRPPQEFMSFDPISNAYSMLLDCPTTKAVKTGCVSADGLGYYCVDGDANLFYYRIATDTWTLITSVFYNQSAANITNTLRSRGSGDIAIDGGGNLWWLCSSGSQYGLYRMNAPLPTTNQASMTATQIIAPTTSTPSNKSITGISFNPTGQIFISTGGSDNKFFLLENNSTLATLNNLNTDGVGADLTSCNFPLSVLPVSWQGFSAVKQNNNEVNLTWIIAQQKDVKGYYVEHSADGSNWKTIGFVNASNTNAASHKYSFIHQNILSGKQYYRIRQTDFDGSSNYSAIEAVEVINNATVKIWSNNRNIVQIEQTKGSRNQPTKAMLFDFSGRIISQNILHEGSGTIDMNGLSAGTYVVSVQLPEGKTHSQKIIKQ